MKDAHQQRVVTEKAELDAKLERLGLFVCGHVFPGIPADEQDRLRIQLHLMRAYSAVLGARIASFGVKS